MFEIPEQSIEKLKRQNPWVSLLKIFMCFVVVFDHYKPATDCLSNRFVDLFSHIAVPCFMFLSFFFMGNDIKLLKIERIKNRLKRLYVPIFVCNIFYWSFKNLFSFFTKSQDYIDIKALFENLIFTHFPSTHQLWFLFSQIIILILICVVLSYAKSDNSKKIILLVMLGLAFVFEYKGINSDLFGSSGVTIKYPLARCVECIPFAVSGILFSWYSNKIQNVHKIILIIFLVTVAVASKIFLTDLEEFGYSGIYLLFSSSAICIISFTVPDKIKGKTRTAINYIGARTMGIYCLHTFIGNIFVKISSVSFLGKYLNVNSLIFDVLIFTVCLVISVLIRLINKKTKFKCIEYIV